ncbi:trans-aconitate 2-methyltransferase [Streptomyces glomeratus]|uniref:Trans-aconitate 2-methyltransferase n=1 Tax=Streptomyces glomeratus TaxID=284452 RepID=A0ABP6LTY7_9ACTN|nr:trans-aconitate 2-methyltransferase [Streptomyces glomeratus]MCF1506305.1 trans-aconitate 2-methyltransferase [Streptomyces glomeratus]
MPAAPAWDPAQYLRHADHRARPFVDLLARVPMLPDSPPRIADLGCGPGNVTVLLADRWPAAHITGYDNSPEMLDRAHTHHEGPTADGGTSLFERSRELGGGRLDFAHADARTWTPAEPYDLIISNATLQWVPGHTARFPDWVDALKPGGTFAFQVPGNFDSPSHRLMRELAHSARWKDRLAGTLRHDDAVLTPGAYLEQLTALGCTADVWETTYLHLLQGEDPVLDWVKGTGLRPVLTELGEEAEEFLTDYRAALREAYPATGHGTVFPFRRIFAVATKGA